MDAEEIRADAGPAPLTAEQVFLPARPENSHKGDYGRVLIVGGSVGYTGAPNLASAAAVRAGTGLVYLGVPEAIWAVCAVKNTEAMPFPLPCDASGRLSAAALPLLRERWSGCGVLALGPGLGRSEDTAALTETAILEYPGRLVLDADALWAAARDPEILRRARGSVVITPHAGEFRRLGGEITGNRNTDACAFAERFGCAVVLKGSGTIIAFPEGESYILGVGNPGMAKGGSGDVLTGITAAMLAQLPFRQAICTAAWLHSAAADACAEALGEYGMTPSDIIEKLPITMKGITRTRHETNDPVADDDPVSHRLRPGAGQAGV